MAHAIRQLSLEEIGLVSGGEASGDQTSNDTRAIDVAACMASLATMGGYAVLGVTGPWAAFGFAGAALGALSSCTADG